MIMISSVPIALLVIENNGHVTVTWHNLRLRHWLICYCIKKSKTQGIVVPQRQNNRHFASASFPCKGLVRHIFDMRIPWFWKQIWHGSISGNICLIEVSNPAKFDAFIKKRTILSPNSWTIRTVLFTIKHFPISLIRSSFKTDCSRCTLTNV